MSFFSFQTLYASIFFLFYSTIDGKPIDAYQSYPNQQWSILNRTLNNNLKVATPLALPCYSQYNGKSVQSQPAQCASIEASYTSAFYRLDQFSAYMNTQSEICDNSITQQCLLDPNSPANPQAYSNKSCNQGAISPYYIEVSCADDVKKAFSFASSTHTPLVIKNTGHDYNGRSSGPGSLGLWTRKLQDMQYHDSFIPSGCNYRAGTRAITTGAGVVFDQVYEFANQHNFTFVGGSGPGVGVSGGWVMTGGHGFLSPVYGLGIDRVLEFQIVTPDGVQRTVNECQNPDLFWALRGGGGSTFGVVLSSTHRVEPTMSLSVAFLSLPATSSPETQREFLELLASTSLDRANQGWGGVQTTSEVILVNPLLDLSSARSSLSPILEYISAHNGSTTLETLPNWYALYTKYVKPGAQSAGVSIFSNNRIIPNDVVSSAHGLKKVNAYIDWISSSGLQPIILSTTPYLYSGNGNNTKVKSYSYGKATSTSATPAWRNSVFMITTQATWAWNSTIDEKEKVINLLKEVSNKGTELAPNAGAYGNEAQPWTEDWEQAFWGANYQKLLTLKRKLDPKGLLSCRHCVGGKDNDVVGGKCLGSLGD